MDPRKVAWSFLIGLSLLASVPLVTAHAPSPHDAAAVGFSSTPSIRGNVTNCTSQSTCTYAFSNAGGNGWANSTLSGTGPLRMALQLPGESIPSYNLSYTTSTQRVTNNYPTYIYWTVGSFLGTDSNTGHILYGTTNTNYSATCHVVYRWCHYTYVTDNGTIVVHPTNARPTGTTFTCSPTTFHPQQKTSCTVTVTNLWNASNYPTGKVHLSDGGTGAGSFSNKGTCALVNGTCSFSFRSSDNACGLIYLSASFLGNAAYYKSGAETSIDVYVSGGC
ncbi:MAG TPA: hypothetical protein VGV89_05855 [Thermoplasmata archaeon]|nr:hypothetical protein [Thermoplasmata archaeon]